MAYNNFDALFNALVSDPHGKANFGSSTLQGLSNIFSSFWSELLDKLSEEPTHAFLENDQIINESVFYYIQDKINLDDGNPSINYLSYFKNNSFWNTSVKDLINNLDKAFNPLETLIGGITLNDVLNGNAGYSFDFSSENWVKAWKNASNETYHQVRGNDVIKPVIEYSSQLQFTNQAANLVLRLLMPKYLRYVEVEDLNRNFWVISQTLTGLCNFIFGSKGLKPVIDGILNEIIQLWQNVEYLWGAYALLSQPQYYTDVHCEVIPVSNDTIRNYIKFDDFDSSIGTPQQYLAAAWNRLSYLKDQYSESNLCIVPQFRINNYSHNYYITEYYPGVILYNRNNNQVNYLYSSDSSKIAINPSHYGDRIGAYDEEGEQYLKKFKDMNMLVTEELDAIGMLRTIPSQFNVTFGEKFSSITLQLDVYDAAFEAIYNQKKQIAKWNLNLTNSDIPESGNADIKAKINETIIAPVISDNSLTPAKAIKGYYKGELSTDFCDIDYIPFELSNYIMQNVSSSTPEPGYEASWAWEVFSFTNGNEDFQGRSSQGIFSGKYIGNEGNVDNKYYGQHGLQRVYFIEGAAGETFEEEDFKIYAKYKRKNITPVSDSDIAAYNRIEAKMYDANYIEFELNFFNNQGTPEEGMKITGTSEDLYLGDKNIGDILFSGASINNTLPAQGTSAYNQLSGKRILCLNYVHAMNDKYVFTFNLLKTTS